MINVLVQYKGEIYYVTAIYYNAALVGLCPYCKKNKNGEVLLPINCLVKECKPITLYPEILEANKFKFAGRHEWRDDIFVTKYRYRDENGDIKFEINYTPKYDGFTWKGIEINYVHQLQHALRLCGLNELADNFKV